MINKSIQAVNYGWLRSVIPNRRGGVGRWKAGKAGSRARARPQSPGLIGGTGRSRGRSRTLDAQPSAQPSRQRVGGLQFNPHPCPPARVAEGGFDFDARPGERRKGGWRGESAGESEVRAPQAPKPPERRSGVFQSVKVICPSLHHHLSFIEFEKVGFSFVTCPNRVPIHMGQLDFYQPGIKPQGVLKQG